MHPVRRLYYKCHMAMDAMVVLRMPRKVREALKASAEADMRSMSAMAVKILTEQLTATGFLKAKKPNRAKR